MAETLVSPGVITSENDQSFLQQQPVEAGAAIIGPTVKGPVEIPTIVTTYSEYQSVFGSTFESGSDEYSFLTSTSAYNYFNNGGNSLLVTRVVSGSSNWAYASSSIPSAIGGGNAVTLEILYKGEIFNNSGSNLDFATGSLYSGSSDNIRWEVVNASTASGEFDLIIRRGDDNHNNKRVLETWTGLSLDPKSTNYIARVIGDQKYQYNSVENYIEVTGSYRNASRYVRVKSVDAKTPNYFDNAGDAKSDYTGDIPAVGSGSIAGTFQGGVGSIIPNGRTMNLNHNINSTDSQGLVGDDYDEMINLLSNQDDYRFNIITVPGLTDSYHTNQLTTLISTIQSRGDAILVYDTVGHASSITAVVGTASTRNTSYAATYWPWVQIIDPNTGDQVWVPASTVIPGVYAFNDNVAEAWFAPAGVSRGGLSTVVRPERKLSQANRDTLYQGKVNPIASFPGTGIVVYGQKTLQKEASALDRINVRRLLIELKSYIGQLAQNLVFEQNTAATRNSFLSQVNPYLETVVNRQGLYAFKVVMDESNNTPDVIDRNQLIGAIFVQPTKTAEFIRLDFNILPTGATFPV